MRIVTFLALLGLICWAFGGVVQGDDGSDAELQRKLAAAEGALAALQQRLASVEQRAAALQSAAPQSKPAIPPPPVVAEQPSGVDEQYDRFTGERSLALAPRSLLGWHKDTAGAWAMFQVGWTAQASDGTVARHTLHFSAPGPTQRWGGGEIRVFLLIDGRRSSTEARVTLVDDGAEGVERIDLDVDAAAASALAEAKRVEARIGDWQFEVPAKFLADVRALLTRASAVPRAR